MTHDDPRDPLHELDALSARYADLIGPETEADPAMTRLLGDLDAHYAVETPAALASALDAAILRRGAGHSVRGIGLAPQISVSQRPVRQAEGAMVMRARRASTLFGSIAAVIVVGLLAAVLIGLARGGAGPAQTGSETPAQRFARLGGTQIVVQVNPCQVGAVTTPTNCSVSAQIAAMIQAEQTRAANGLGVKDAIVTNPVENQIQIQLPGYTDTDRAGAVLSASDDLDVVDTGDSLLPPGTDLSSHLCPYGYPCPSNSYIVYFTGSQIDTSSVKAGIDSTTGKPFVTFAFAGAARNAFATYTSQRIGKTLTLTLDGVVVESATVQSEITGNVQITGLGTVTKAQTLASTLKSGPFPIPAFLLSETLFGPGGTCPTPQPGAPGVTPGPATPAPNATDTPAPYPTLTPPPTPSPTLSGQSNNFAPVLSGGPGRNGDCGTPIPTITPGGAPIPPTPSRIPGTATPKP